VCEVGSAKGTLLSRETLTKGDPSLGQSELHVTRLPRRHDDFGLALTKEAT